MTDKYKKIIYVFAGLLTMGVVALTPVMVNAQDAKPQACGILPESVCGSSPLNAKPTDGKVRGTAVWQLLLAVINIMTAGVAILAVGGIIYGAVLYTSAGPNRAQVVKAREILMNVVIGVVAFTIMFGLLQWLIPGGVFNNV